MLINLAKKDLCRNNMPLLSSKAPLLQNKRALLEINAGLLETENHLAKAFVNGTVRDKMFVCCWSRIYI